MKPSIQLLLGLLLFGKLFAQTENRTSIFELEVDAPYWLGRYSGTPAVLAKDKPTRLDYHHRVAPSFAVGYRWKKGRVLSWAVQLGYTPRGQVSGSTRFESLASNRRDGDSWRSLVSGGYPSAGGAVNNPFLSSSPRTAKRIDDQGSGIDASGVRPLLMAYSDLDRNGADNSSLEISESGHSSALDLSFGPSYEWSNRHMRLMGYATAGLRWVRRSISYYSHYEARVGSRLDSPYVYQDPTGFFYQELVTHEPRTEASSSENTLSKNLFVVNGRLGLSYGFIIKSRLIIDYRVELNASLGGLSSGGEKLFFFVIFLMG